MARTFKDRKLTAEEKEKRNREKQSGGKKRLKPEGKPKYKNEIYED